MLRLHPEQREIEQLEALDRRHATLDERTLDHTGIAEMVLRADWCDLSHFNRVNRALSEVAAAPAREGVEEALDVRRSLAVGVLADPDTARALLAGDTDPTDPARWPRRQVVLYLHLSDLALIGLYPVGHDEVGRPVLDQLVRRWCGRTDTHLSIRPVIDLDIHT